MSDILEAREKLLEYLESQLVGPAADDEAIPKSDRPYERYAMGAIFPRGASKKAIDPAEDNSETGASDEGENPVSTAYEFMPSSVGLSFVTSAETVEVLIRGAHYSIDEDDAWKRTVLASEESPERHTLSIRGQNKKDVLVGTADLISTWRRLEGRFLITVTLINNARAEANGRFDAGEVLHQVGITCTPVSGSIEAYPSPNRYSWDEEEEELALIYQHKKTFGLGHGCSAHWEKSAGASVPSIRTEFIPRYEIPPVTANLPETHPLKDSPVFSIQFLAGPTPFKEKLSHLVEFTASYQKWIQAQLASGNIPDGLQNAADRLEERLTHALGRMKKGIELLKGDADAQTCFTLANRAMLLQMIHAATGKYGGREKDQGTPYEAPDIMGEEWKHFRWHPFQLAFQLLIIESVANRNSENRDILDLIWFPTGGGKTEAYLTIAAFEMFYRRIKFGDAGGGTAVIKRYTLRLLTVQQFERAATLICACEKIRAGQPDLLGEEQFTLGLWVGDNTIPNKFTDAYQKYLGLLEEEVPESPFLLRKCPWCGTRLVPVKHSENTDLYGIRADENNLRLFCPEPTCDFHKELPVNIIDEDLYRNPPTMLIGTIDKFARPAWTEGPRAFFTGGPTGHRLPPSLIIQDELHLISGPLGTIAGLYEAAFDVIMQASGGNPKYIAATATIRRAKEQVTRLYAREVAVFPPSGMSAGDSFFSREEASATGRLYAGILSPYLSPATANIHASAALAQGPVELDLSHGAKDAYWTQVIFHNSRRELGKTMTKCLDDIPARIRVIASTDNQARECPEVIEMSANIAAENIPAVLNRLKSDVDSGEAVDFLPCTNMFSVGVDVQRLGLIVVQGQPKSTAEYIQVSSRVGRSKDIPGLVIALYPNSKARDRSLYESFIPYHQALYRAVEPTSVTPYSGPAMSRALHAAIVIVMRMCGGLSGNESARFFDMHNTEIAELLTKLRNRMHRAAQNEEEIDIIFDRCIKTWTQKAQSTQNLVYEARDAQNFSPVLSPFEPGVYPKPQIPWQTLNSMRNVDQECRVHVLGEN